MEAYLLDWANLLLRWLHVIVAIAWIGSSFYFVFLDNNLLKPTDPELQKKGVDGAMWAVHGGGFYHPQKYLVSPPKIDSELHWFYWESYSTWLSGFALFSVLYLWNADTFLVDKNLHDWSPVAAGFTAVGFLVAFWFVYDGICRWAGVGPKARAGDGVIGALVLLVLAVACWGACQLFPGRAAFLVIGAMLATSMTANVAHWIIPGQRTVVADMQAGKTPDPIYGQRGKQRSVHNTYFTLPVLFAMLSNHYGFLYGSAYNWVILLAMMLSGAAIRQFFVQRHGWRHGRAPHPWPWAAGGVVVLLAVIVGVKAVQPAAPISVAPSAPPSFAQVQAVLNQRCLSCHGPQVQMKNLRFDDPATVLANAQNIHQQVAVLRLMPMNNATGITDAERALIAAWVKAGAKTD